MNEKTRFPEEHRPYVPVPMGWMNFDFDDDGWVVFHGVGDNLTGPAKGMSAHATMDKRRARLDDMREPYPVERIVFKLGKPRVSIACHGGLPVRRYSKISS